MSAVPFHRICYQCQNNPRAQNTIRHFLWFPDSIPDFKKFLFLKVKTILLDWTRVRKRYWDVIVCLFCLLPNPTCSFLAHMYYASKFGTIKFWHFNVQTAEGAVRLAWSVCTFPAAKWFCIVWTNFRNKQWCSWRSGHYVNEWKMIATHVGVASSWCSRFSSNGLKTCHIGKLETLL